VQPAAVPTVTTDSIAKLEGEIRALERQVDEVRVQAAEVEQKKAASQKDEIIAQMRSKLQATHAGTKQLEAENATLMNKIAQAETTLRSRGLHVQ
jgi:predicted  nucleic acid-binding Zn-ribbon protein